MARGQGGQKRPDRRPPRPEGRPERPPAPARAPRSGPSPAPEAGARRPPRTPRGGADRFERPAGPSRPPRSGPSAAPDASERRPPRPPRGAGSRFERPGGPSRPERPAAGEWPAGSERSRRAPWSDRPARAEAPAGREPSRRPPRTDRAPRPDRAPRGEAPAGFDRPPPRPRRPAPERAPREDIVYGRNPVLEAGRAGRIKRLHMATGTEPDPRLDEIRALGVPVLPADAAALERLSDGGVHQGVVAEVRPRHFLTLRQLLDATPRPDLLVALDSILDPQNLGAILRSAEVAGADAAILPERRSAPLSAVAAKASAGATEHLTLARVSGLAGAVSDIRRSSIWCVALDPHGELLPWEFDFTQPVCLVVGGEGAGVHRLVRERCDARVRLPMAGRVESLNASAAAAVLLYEVARQRASTPRR